MGPSFHSNIFVRLINEIPKKTVARIINLHRLLVANKPEQGTCLTHVVRHICIILSVKAGFNLEFIIPVLQDLENDGDDVSGFRSTALCSTLNIRYVRALLDCHSLLIITRAIDTQDSLVFQFPAWSQYTGYSDNLRYSKIIVIQ